MGCRVNKKKQRLLELCKKLSLRHLSFAHLLLEGKKLEAAYMEVYPTTKKKETARKNGGRLKANEGITEYIELQQQLASETAMDRLGITEERILAELAKLGFANVQDYYNDYGSMIPINEMPGDVAASIQTVKTRQIYGGHGEEIGTMVEIKGYDKRAALIDLGKHLGMFKENVRHDVADPLKDILERIGKRNALRSPLPSGQ